MVDFPMQMDLKKRKRAVEERKRFKIEQERKEREALIEKWKKELPAAS